MRPLVGLRSFEGGRKKSVIRRAGERYHGKTVRKRSEARATLVRGISGRDEKDLIEPEAASSRFGSLQMPDMNRVESSAKERDSHRLESPAGG